ncbi:uncharacterized protein MYCFIDRAFT_82944 [Pseudocercospora fijiensis CIRAD86]|uniref:Uncharacterized protein n=1 Tax=Pseudocercospora fijiensis (strain CIRAD86) TaxID=383855 RepID=M3B676_PSEFD|nr:uncharacterized protein MYCFIDRAFT_82944 [Pseudocercospora fijiensis CIRAD86]EME84872.1 hypothetical protein MYCFIDRAFT_82944 [Pseudocercospora fijiensis CIRAD86]
MASTRRLTSRVLPQIHKLQAQRRHFWKKPGSHDHVPEVNAREFDIAFDVGKYRRTRRDGALKFISEHMRREFKTRRFWTDVLILSAITLMVPPWEDTPKNREWVEKYGLPKWFLVKSRRQKEEEEAAGANHRGCGSEEDGLVEEWAKMQ